MEEKEIIYIPYGLDEIDYKQFQLNLANNYLEYLKGRHWAKKLKNVDAWMKAYNNILKQGITGASVENGQWSINHNGKNFEYANPLEKSMYEDVASYLVELMKAMPKRKKEEEKKKTSYDYKIFLQGLLDYIGRELFGGQPDYISKWTNYDELPKNGLRGTAKRQAAMAELLKGYKDYINKHKDEYDFESYNGIDNWNNRVDRALVALNNPEWNDEDKHSLDALGLNYNTWFNNGGSDPLIVGNQQMTRELYVNEYLPQLEKLKKEAEIKKLQAELKKINDNKYKNFRFFNASKLAGTPPTGNDSLLKLNSYASLPLLNGQLLSELIGAFKFAAKNGILQNISKEELQKFGPRWSENRLKKINGLNGFYWDSIGNRVVQPFLNEAPQVGFLDLVNLNSPDTISKKQLEKNLKPRLLSEGLLYEDYARMGAALGDVISLGGFWANVGGSIVSLLGDTTADIADDKISTWEAVKNLGKNLGWTAAGFIPGGKLGKVAEHMLRWGPKLLVALNDYNLLTDESNKKTWNKLTSDKLVKEGLNDEDLKNITYWIRALTGTANTAKATARDIKYSKARGTLGQEFNTKDGTKVTLSNKDVLEINVAGARKGLKAAEELFKSKTGKEVADNSFKFSENGRSGLFKNIRSKLLDLLLLGKSTVFRTPEQQRYYDLLRLDRNIGGYGGWRPFWQRGTSSYFDHFDSGLSFRNPLNGVMRKMDPYRNMTPNSSSGTPSNGIPNVSRTREIPDNFKATGKAPNLPKHNMTRKEWKKANKKLYNDIDKKGKYTNNTPEEGTYQFKDPVGNTHTYKLVLRDDDFLLNITSSNGEHKEIPLSLDQVKLGVWNNIKQSLNTGLRNDISIPANIIRTLLGTAYGWLKQGGTIDKQKIQKYIEFIKK